MSNSVSAAFNYEWEITGNLKTINEHLRCLVYIQVSTAIKAGGWYRDDFEQHTILVVYHEATNKYTMYFWFNFDPRPTFHMLLSMLER